MRFHPGSFAFLATLASLTLTILSMAQQPTGKLRVIHSPHPVAQSKQTVRFVAQDLQFNLLFLLFRNPAKGPLGQTCMVNPIGCLGDFELLSAQASFNGGATLTYATPADLTVPFVAAGFDTRTSKFAISPVETILTRIRFQNVVIDKPSPRNPHCKTIGDIDGDGFPDALAASSSGGTGVFWYDAKAAWKKHRIATGNYTTDMQVADIDNDGDLDVVIPSSSTGNLTWFENPRPKGNPESAWRAQVIGKTNAHDVEIGDVDGDGDIDVVTRAKTGSNTIVWLQQTPSTWTKIVAHTKAGEGTALGDLDGDGDLDIAHNGFWAEAPSKLTATPWPIHTIDKNWPRDVGVTIADMNVDGRPDILLAPSESSNGRLSWYEAPGNPKTGTWRQHVIDSQVSYVHTFKTGDVDNDGDLDVVTAEMHQSKNDEVSVYYNQGGALKWSQEVVARTGSHNVRIGDFDSDGDLDIFGANWSGSASNGAPIELWRSQLSDWKRPRLALDRWRRHVIDSSKPWRSVFVGAKDLDGDGLPDMVTGGWWYKNPGKINGTWSRRTLGSPLHNMAAVFDFDGDGDPDILGTNGQVNGSRFAWARNDGGGRFTILQNIAGGDGDFLQGVAVSRFTPASNSSTNCQVALSWHIAKKGIQLLTVPTNPSSGTWKWSRIASISQDEALSVGDIDRDGRQDLLLGTRWLRNTGTSWSTFTLNPVSGAPDRNRLADVNNDGRLDAIIGFEGISRPAKLAWYEQPGNATSTWIEHPIATPVGPMSLDVDDLDNDGDVDLVVGEHNLQKPGSAKLVVFENLGQGRQWRSHLVHSGDEHHDGAILVDLDRDGDLDVISIGWGHNRVLVYENLAR